MQTNIEEICNKYNYCETLSDDEIIEAYLHFKKLSELLHKSGAEWYIIEREATQYSQGFRRLMYARNLTVKINRVEQ